MSDEESRAVRLSPFIEYAFSFLHSLKSAVAQYIAVRLSPNIKFVDSNFWSRGVKIVFLSHMYICGRE